MIICRTHIVDCLRRRGIQPVASGTVLYDNFNFYNPMHALDYENNNYYHSNNNPNHGGWIVDLKTKVTVFSYQIKLEQRCNYMSNWSIQFSDKNESSSFKTIHSQGDKFPGNETYKLPFMCTSRYFRVIGTSPLCKINAIAFIYIKFFGCIGKFRTQNIRNFRQHSIFLISVINALTLYASN